MTSIQRLTGQSHMMQRRTADSTVTVPVPDHSELRAGTLQSIIRQSGLPRELFAEDASAAFFRH